MADGPGWRLPGLSSVLLWSPLVVKPARGESPSFDWECSWCELLQGGSSCAYCRCGGPLRVAVFSEPRQRRVALDLSRERVADMTGLSLATVCAVESGWTGLNGSEWHVERFSARILAALDEYAAMDRPKRSKKRPRGWSRH